MATTTEPRTRKRDIVKNAWHEHVVKPLRERQHQQQDQVAITGPDGVTNQVAGLKIDDEPYSDNDSQDDDDEEEEEEEEWNQGYAHWKQVRQQWLSPSSSPHDGSGSSSNANAPAEENFARIYDLLINQGRRLKAPLNLAVATKILVAGWQAAGQWPPQPQPQSADPLIGHRRRRLATGM
ncbi:hypothetical protein V1514DRAFT_327651 [Lipomyces japonicus]|uniref:uncharacterized protein n=1 Tax=Lipomyces japonicus TaxID=56871 RepID=UPI0034CFCD45